MVQPNKALVGLFAGKDTHGRGNVYYSHAFEVSADEINADSPQQRPTQGPLSLAFARINNEWRVTIFYTNERMGAARFEKELQNWVKKPNLSAFDRSFCADLEAYGLTPDAYLKLVTRLLRIIEYRERHNPTRYSPDPADT